MQTGGMWVSVVDGQAGWGQRAGVGDEKAGGTLGRRGPPVRLGLTLSGLLTMS